MGRPFVQVPTENRLSKLRAHLDAHLPAFKALPGVVGLTLNGGMSRGYADHLSEVDLTVFLTPDAYAGWQAGGMAELPQGIHMIDGQLYDLKVIDIEKEMGEPVSEVGRWDTSYAEILYDPEGKVAALQAAKLTTARPAAASGLLFSAWWHFALATPIWLHRQDGLQAHLMLNRAIEPLVGALFMANGEYVPHEKWVIHMSRSLAWKPERWEERLFAAMQVTAPTVAAAAARRDVVVALWEEIDHRIAGAGAPVNVMHQFFYALLSWLVERGEVPVAEWTARASLGMLHLAPFAECARLEGDVIRLDRERFLALGPQDLDPWFYTVVAAVHK